MSHFNSKYTFAFQNPHYIVVPSDELNPLTVKKMIHDIIKNVHGTTSYGQLQHYFEHVLN